MSQLISAEQERRKISLSPPLGDIACRLLAKTTLAIAILAMGLTAPASTEAMRFTLSGNGGNCDTCEWLAAEGDIMADALDQLAAYLKQLSKEFGTDWHGTVLLNSRGGNLFGGR